MRTCIGCRRKKEQNQLLRVSRSSDQQFSISEKGRFGRGAYMCKEWSCITQATKRERLSRALRSKVSEAELDALYAILRSLLDQTPVQTNLTNAN